MMLMNLLFGVLTMTACLLLQSLLLVTVIRYYLGHERHLRSPSFRGKLVVINGVMLMLVLGNLAQVAIWAVLFQLLGEFHAFSAAFYHSAVNFATLGYGDIVMSDEHKLLGPIQAINGVLMIGFSTAILMAAVQDVTRRTIQERQH